MLLKKKKNVGGKNYDHCHCVKADICRLLRVNTLQAFIYLLSELLSSHQYYLFNYFLL